MLTTHPPSSAEVKKELSYTNCLPRNFFWGGSTNSVEDRRQRERGSGGGNALVRGSGGSCNLVQNFHFI